MDIYGILGYIGVCAFYPASLWRIYRYRSVAGLSKAALWSLALGLLSLEVSMIIYGGYPIYWIGNGIGLLCSVGLLAGCYLYGEAK